MGVGRRKTSVAKAYLVEGNGGVIINGRGLNQAFPRLHDRESALWPLKVGERLDRYNVFLLVHGGGSTGQAEAAALAVAKALLVHEPALKSNLRKGESPIGFEVFLAVGANLNSSGLHYARSQDRGEEEAGQVEGAQVTNMGQALKDIDAEPACRVAGSLRVNTAREFTRSLLVPMLCP